MSRGKNGTFVQEILNEWIESIKLKPDLSVNKFIDKYDILENDRDEIKKLLTSTLIANKYFEIKISAQTKNQILDMATEHFKRKNSSKKESLLQILFPKQRKLQTAYRNQDVKLSKKDAKIIDEFTKKIKENKD